MPTPCSQERREELELDTAAGITWQQVKELLQGGKVHLELGNLARWH